MSYPGSEVTRPWLYKTDYAFWVTSQGWMAPAGPGGAYGEGTDLGGGLWFHDPTTVGADAHGLHDFLCDPTTKACSIADGFAFGIAPDPKRTETTGGKLLVDAHAFNLCPPLCPLFDHLDAVIRWPPMLTLTPDASEVQLWSADRGIAPEGLLSEALARLLVDPAARTVHASETALVRSDALLKTQLRELTGELGERSSPRGLALMRAAGGWSLVAIVPTSTGGFDVAPVETLSGEVAHVLSPWLDEGTGTALAYSRTADMLFVLHDGSAGRPMMLVRRRPRPNLAPAGAWTLREVGEMGRLSQPEMVFSPRDWHLWLVDREGPRASWTLRRIDTASAAVRSFKALPSLDGASEIWLAVVDDGRVLLAANEPGTNTYILALLTSNPFGTRSELTVAGSVTGVGQLMGPPQVAQGVITSLVHPKLGDYKLSPATQAYTAALLEEPWPRLEEDLRRDDLSP